MRFIALVFLVFVNFFNGHSQCSEARIKSFLNTADEQRRKNPTASISAANKALYCAEQLKLYRYSSKALNILGFHNLMEGKTVAAYKQFQRSLNLSEKIKNDTAVAIAENNLGNYYNYLGLDELALEHYLKSLKLKQKIHLEGVDVGFVNVGIIYDKQGKHHEALDFYRQALEIKQKNQDEQGVALVYENMGIAEAELNHYDKALDYFEKAVVIYQNIGYGQGILAVKISEAVLHQQRGSFEESEKILEEIRSQVLVDKDVSRIHMWYKTYAAVMLDKKNYNVAISLADSSLKYAELTQDLSAIIQSFSDLSKAYKATGDNFKALTLENRALTLKDSLNALNSEVAIEELQLRYETEVLNNKIEVQQKNIELLHLQNRNRLYLIGFILLLAIAAIIGIAMKYRSNAKQKKSLRVELDHRNKELLSFTVQTAKKNEAIQKLKESFDADITSVNTSDRREIQTLFKEVERTEDNWQEFRMRFEKIEPEFFGKLSNKYQLSETDLRICALIKLNVTTQEAANMLSITAESVNKARYRLRKKLDLPKDEELNQFIRNFK